MIRYFTSPQPIIISFQIISKSHHHQKVIIFSPTKQKSNTYEFESCCYHPRRLKSFQNHYYLTTTTPSSLAPVVEEASSPRSHGYGGGSYNKEMISSSTMKKTRSGVLSSHSKAARERRRKIAEKTQELGKLIPGGNKMNTSEIFHSASNNVNFLHAKVSLLELMGSIQKSKKEVELHAQGLEVFASQTIREKPYTKEKCLVPIEFVQVLVNVPEIQSTPLFKDIDQLMTQNQGLIRQSDRDF